MHYILMFMVFSFVYPCVRTQVTTERKKFQCFKCESAYGGLCTDGFHSTGVQVVDCTGTCVKIKYHITVDDLTSLGYSRYCREDEVPPGCSVTDDFHNKRTVHIETTTCNCNRNLCNGQMTIRLATCTSVLAGALWVLLFQS